MKTIIVIIEPSNDEIEIFCGSPSEFGLILDVVASDLSDLCRQNLKAHIEKNWNKHEIPIFQNSEEYFLQLRFD